MLAGPVFHREIAILPRRIAHFIVRTLYVASLFGLIVTALLLLTGSQEIRNTGDWARFGTIVFQVLAPLQLTLMIFLAGMSTASAVAHEKDRRTLVMLLLTSLTNRELVLGPLLASLLNIVIMLVAAIPIFLFVTMLGGVSYRQVLLVELVTLLSILLAGSIGSLLALWREKTFQALALTALALVVWLLLGEALVLSNSTTILLGRTAHDWANVVSPWRAIQQALSPIPTATNSQALFQQLGGPFALFAVVAILMFNFISVWKVRAWNISAGTRPGSSHVKGVTSQANESLEINALVNENSVPAKKTKARLTKSRAVWSNPVLWREIRTWAYGKKVLLVRMIYVTIGIAAILSANSLLSNSEVFTSTTLIPQASKPIIPLLAISIAMINALAVTSVTNERDGQALDLLLVTDLSAKEFVYGKLFGVFYNAKEMILLPVLMCGFFWFQGYMSSYNFFYIACGLMVMNAFAAMLGVHAGMTYPNTRTAIATSLGTLLFLFLGVSTCMRMMVAFKGSYLHQLGAFSAFLGGGGLALYFALGWRNPSRAIFYYFHLRSVCYFFCDDELFSSTIRGNVFCFSPGIRWFNICHACTCG